VTREKPLQIHTELTRQILRAVSIRTAWSCHGKSSQFVPQACAPSGVPLEC